MSTSRVVTPGWMNADTSSSTRLATTQAGRIDSRSRSVFRMIFNSQGGSEAAFDASLLEESIVVSHQEVRFHLSHGVQQNAHRDQNAGAAKKPRDTRVDIEPLA